MFTKLPDLFGRNFVIGYLLPAFIFIVTVYLIDSEYAFLASNLNLAFLSQLALLEQVTVLGLLSFFVSVFLLIFNRPIISILEGYGKFNPFRLFARWEKGYFHRLESEIAETESRYFSYLDQGKEVPLVTKNKYLSLKQQRSPRFPDQERWLLPTAFGNTLRAFETYARVMYGADAIPVWTRLLAVIPEHYREYLETAKMLVDFWVNTWVVSVVLLGVYCGNVLYFREVQLWWLPLVCLGVVYLSLEQAQRAALGWGNFVKAAFDLFLGDLQQQLKLKPTESSSQVWQQFSQGVLYIDPDVMPEKHKGEDVSESQE